MEKSKTMIDQLPPRTAFWAGVLISAGVLCAAGFLLLLVMMLKGVELGSTSDTSKTSNKNIAVADDTVTANANTNVAAATSVDTSSFTNVRGSGDVTIVEYSDIDCPFCQRFHGTMQQVMDEYDGKVQWAYMHFPLTSLHPNANQKALATECAAEQDNFWEYVDALFANESTSTDEITDEADALGLDRTQFDDCLATAKYQDQIDAASSVAQDLGGRGTPFSVIVDADGNILETIPGALPYESVQQLIDANLE